MRFVPDCFGELMEVLMVLADVANILASMEHQVDHLRGYVGIDRALSAFAHQVWTDNRYGWQSMNPYQLSALIFSTICFFHDEDEKLLIAGPIGKDPAWIYTEGTWRRIP